MSNAFRFPGIFPGVTASRTTSPVRSAAAAPAAPGTSNDAPLISALSYSALLMADASALKTAGEIIAFARDAYGSPLSLRLANLSVTLQSGLLDADSAEKHMEALFSAEELKTPIIQMIRASLIVLEQVYLPNCDWYKVGRAKETLKNYLKSEDADIRSRAEEILKLAEKHTG